MDELVIREIKRNYWLNGMAELEDGDPLAGIENSEMVKKIHEVKSEYELWKCIRNYGGTFKYRNLYFANHPHFGCFVYIVKDRAYEFEHISFEKYERFKAWLERVFEIDAKTKTVEEFRKTYYNL
jgi:hypothetical protein